LTPGLRVVLEFLVKSCSSKHHFCRKRFQWLWNCGKPHVT